MNAAAVLMGFRWRSIRLANGITSAGSPSPPAYFLAETSNASVAYFEEAGEDGVEDGVEDANTKANKVAGEKTDA